MAMTLLIAALIITIIVALKLSAYRIETGSMAPDFPIGTVVVESGLAPVALHRAATFTADGATVTHVLVGYNVDGSLVTRGIANSSNDAWHTPVYPRDVHGRVLFSVLLFAPTFWAGWHGSGFIACAVLFIAVVVWMRIRRRAVRTPFDRYSRLQSNSK